jgi:hypothetical protein
VLRKESGLSSPRAARFLIGNPLIMKEMPSTYRKPQAMRSGSKVDLMRPDFCSTPRPRILPLHPDVSASYQQATSGCLNRPNDLVYPGPGYFVAGGRSLCDRAGDCSALRKDFRMN